MLLRVSQSSLKYPTMERIILQRCILNIAILAAQHVAGFQSDYRSKSSETGRQQYLLNFKIILYMCILKLHRGVCFNYI